MLPALTPTSSQCREVGRAPPSRSPAAPLEPGSFPSTWTCQRARHREPTARASPRPQHLVSRAHSRSTITVEVDGTAAAWGEPPAVPSGVRASDGDERRLLEAAASVRKMRRPGTTARPSQPDAPESPPTRRHFCGTTRPQPCQAAWAAAPASQSCERQNTGLGSNWSTDCQVSAHIREQQPRLNKNQNYMHYI